MFKVSVVEKGVPPEKFVAFIKQDLYFEAQGKLVELAEETLNNIRETIKNSKKRPSLGSNLEQTIDIEYINTVGGLDLGIGKIGVLKSDAPYFEVLDAGGYVPYSTVKGAPLGSFQGIEPISGASGQNWERSGNKGFFMKPQKPIEGIDYVGKASRFLAERLKTEFSRFMKDTVIQTNTENIYSIRKGMRF